MWVISYRLGREFTLDSCLQGQLALDQTLKCPYLILSYKNKLNSVKHKINKIDSNFVKFFEH